MLENDKQTKQYLTILKELQSRNNEEGLLPQEKDILVKQLLEYTIRSLTSYLKARGQR